MHDSTKVKMGVPLSSEKIIDTWSENPSTFQAGCAVRNNAGALSKSVGQWQGVSLGKSLSDTTKTNVIRAGSGVPMQCTDLKVKASIKKGDITFTAKAFGVVGNEITIAALDTKNDASCEVTVDENDIVLDIEGGATTATTIINALALSPDAMLLINAAIDQGDNAAAQAAFAEDSLENGRESVDYIVIGAKVYIDDATGLVNDPAAASVTICDAIHLSLVMTGINEDSTECLACVVDMPGGL